MVKIAPSVLSADFSQLGAELSRLDAGGADLVHIDVMDGQFVPSITIGADVVKFLHRYTQKPLDVHLMVNNPERQINSFATSGADIITIHLETAPHAHRLVETIKFLGKKAGIALNPATPLVMAEELLNDVDLILIMTVNPGYGGQKFIETMLPKIRRLKNMLHERGSKAEIEVDGGINAATAKLVREAGADILVAGSYVFGANDIATAIKALRD